MKNELEKQTLSRYRGQMAALVEKMKELCMKACHGDLILAGTPIEVYRKCGKAGCRCAEGGDKRHGPYLAVQVRKDSGQRQLSLKGSERAFYKMAQHYQYQMRNRQEIVRTFSELLETIDTLLEARTIWDKK